MSRLIRKIYLLIPLVALIFWVSTNAMTMQRAASLAIVLSIVVGFINRDAHLTPGKILDALSAGGRSAITVGAACGVAGIISGTITMTGLANELINAIVGVAGDKLIIALVLTMLCCIVLGMGVPTTANYCIMAATTAPILIRMGVPIMAAHFFVFYFGIVADITPPVALAAYAGSAIAKSNPMKTAFTASRLAIAAFIVPYMFAFNPAMLLIDTTVLSVIQMTITAVIGIFGVAAGMEGYCFAQMNIVIRLVEVCGGLMLIHPSLITDLCGLALVIGGLAFQYMLGRKK
jgi:TRAP transporter 4TM/12TM fusion protein